MFTPPTNSQDKVVMKVEILSAGKGKVCLDFSKVDGDSLAFYNEFAIIKDYLGDLIDASY